jgi:hypothetical protein
MPGGEPDSDRAFAAAVTAATREGSARHARWDAGVFAALSEGPARALWARIRDEPLATETLVAYLGLLREAVANGYVRGAAWDDANRWEAQRQVSEAERQVTPPPWRSCLEYCLVAAVPSGLPPVAPDRRVSFLAKVWNLGEGLLREPRWVDRYVVSRLGELRDLTQLEDFLVGILEPVLESGPPAEWRGPFRVSVLDLRPVVDDLLPGKMRLASPTLLVVQDRSRPALYVSVLLRRGGRSEALGVSSDLPEHRETVRLPAAEFAVDAVTIAGHSVQLPFVDRVHDHLVVSAGFVVASAIDSQRLWIVESP